jgi:hypothetical protein
VYVWDFAARQHITQHLSEAIAAIAPDAARAAQNAQQASSTRLEALADLFKSANFQAIETMSLDITADFENFEDYWQSNTSLISPINAIGMAGGSLGRDQILLLKQKLRTTLPATNSGRISLVLAPRPCTAWLAPANCPYTLRAASRARGAGGVGGSFAHAFG